MAGLQTRRNPMPRIAITSCSKIGDYEEAVRRAGAEPVIVDQNLSPADVLRQCDGLLLTGGGDVRPSLYGETAHPTFKAAEPGRDEFEIALVQQASVADLPLFAICRGMQVLNVARGGSLVQDIPSQIARPGAHEVREPPNAIAHDVSVQAGSLLHRLMSERAASASSSCAVNSRHHQAVKAVGSDLVVTAVAPDGVIEAVEDPSRRFCLGVQWHPENFWRTGTFAGLFAGLITAAAQRRGKAGNI